MHIKMSLHNSRNIRTVIMTIMIAGNELIVQGEGEILFLLGFLHIN